MGYSLVAYMIDLATLRSAVGSKDASLVRSIRKTDPERFDSDEYGLTLGDALSQLVMGEKLGRKATHQYGYALERLCRHLGEPLDCDEWSGIHGPALEDTGLEAVMEGGPPVKLPTNPDVPRIGFLERQKIIQMVEQMGDESLTSDDEDVQELLTEFEEWVRSAAQAKKDLVLFYY